MITEKRKEEIQDITASAIRYWGKFHNCTFGQDFNQEEKTYAIHVGQNFGVTYENHNQLALIVKGS